MKKCVCAPSMVNSLGCSAQRKEMNRQMPLFFITPVGLVLGMSQKRIAAAYSWLQVLHLQKQQNTRQLRDLGGIF